MRPWISVAYSAPVAAATAVFVIYPIGQGSFSDGMPLGELNCLFYLYFIFCLFNYGLTYFKKRIKFKINLNVKNATTITNTKNNLNSSKDNNVPKETETPGIIVVYCKINSFKYYSETKNIIKRIKQIKVALKYDCKNIDAAMLEDYQTWGKDQFEYTILYQGLEWSEIATRKKKKKELVENEIFCYNKIYVDSRQKEKPIAGIYMILNTKNDKRYYGQSGNIKLRQNKHNFLLDNGLDNKDLQKDFDFFGADAFEFKILFQGSEWSNLDVRRKKESELITSQLGICYNKLYDKPFSNLNPGIYIIRCKINNKKYYGETGNLDERKKTHFQLLHSYSSNQVNKSLLDDYKSFGKNEFEFIVLKSGPEYANFSLRKTIEQEFINENAEMSYNFTGNIQADPSLKRKTKIPQRGIPKNKLGKTIKYITFQGKIFYFQSIATAHRILKTSRKNLRNALKNKKFTALQFLSKEEEDILDPNVFKNIPCEIFLQQLTNNVEKLPSKSGHIDKTEITKKRISQSLKKNLNKKRNKQKIRYFPANGDPFIDFESILAAGQDPRVPLSHSAIQWYFSHPRHRIVYVSPKDVYSNKNNASKDFYYYPEDGSLPVRYKNYLEATSEKKFKLTRGNIQYHLKNPKPHFEKIS